MTSMIVIDLTTRELAVYTANVTKAEAGLVIRKALQLGDLRGAAERIIASTDLPVMILGSGYRAQSSEGFTGRDFWSSGFQHAVIGMQEFGCSLRLIKPQEAVIFTDGRMFERPTMGNSNVQTANAVWQGLKLLRMITRGVIITEGQSDYVSVWELSPLTGEELFAVDVDFVDDEHRADRFTWAQVGAGICVASARRAEAAEGGRGFVGGPYALAYLGLGLTRGGEPREGGPQYPYTMFTLEQRVNMYKGGVALLEQCETAPEEA